MDKTIYERLFSTRAYLVISKAEELCVTCKYESISPTVLFASMMILEKNYLEKVISESDFDYSSVCRKVESKLRSIPKQEKDDYYFSESSNEIISKAILNKKYDVVTIMDLVQELSVSIEINELLDHNCLNQDSLSDLPCQVLEWDDETCEFKLSCHSYYYDKHHQSEITRPTFTGVG